MEMPSPSDFEHRIMLCGVHIYKTAWALDTGFYHSTVQLAQYYLKGVFDVFTKALSRLCRSLRRHISPSLSPFWHCLVGSKTSSPMQFVKAVMLDNLFSLDSVDFNSKDGILGCQPLKPLPDDSNKVVGHILRCSGHFNHNYNLVVLTVHACANC